MALEITDSNFDELVMRSDKAVLLDFGAAWCGPCRTIAPLVDELAKDYEGRAVVGKIDVDLNPQVSVKYGVRNLPTILYFKNGEVVDKQVGAVPKSVLAKKLDAQLQ